MNNQLRSEKDGYRWAREYKSVNSIGPEIKDARALVAPGDLIRVLRDENKWWLAQKPEVESGFVALDPNTGAIQAMIGGFNYFESKFNRATQGGRLVGSGIKPLIYTAALESGMTPATLVNDAPVVFDQTEGQPIGDHKTLAAHFLDQHDFALHYTDPAT